MQSEQIQSIQSQTLIINGNNDVGSVEHAVEMLRNFPNAELAILPGKHGVYIGAIEYLDEKGWTQRYIIAIINEFLDR